MFSETGTSCAAAQSHLYHTASRWRYVMLAAIYMYQNINEEVSDENLTKLLTCTGWYDFLLFALIQKETFIWWRQLYQHYGCKHVLYESWR